MSRRYLLPVLLLALAFVPNPQGAEAQPPPYKKLRFEIDCNEDPEACITGKVQKPELAVEISRQNLNKSYDLTLKESFLPKIVDAVRHDPF